MEKRLKDAKAAANNICVICVICVRWNRGGVIQKCGLDGENGVQMLNIFWFNTKMFAVIEKWTIFAFTFWRCVMNYAKQAEWNTIITSCESAEKSLKFSGFAHIEGVNELNDGESVTT